MRVNCSQINPEAHRCFNPWSAECSFNKLNDDPISGPSLTLLFSFRKRHGFIIFRVVLQVNLASERISYGLR